MRTLDVPQLVRSEVQDRVGDRQMVKQLLYTPPLDGSLDPHRQFDAFIATRVEEILTQNYTGYPWDVKCSAAQGMIWFNLPVLMGPTLNQAIRLAQWGDLNSKIVIDAGKQLLDRMNLPKHFDPESYLKARDQKWLSDFSDVGTGRF